MRDSQGVIPGATVTLTNEGTGVSRDTVSNESGEYSFPALDAGTYTVKASVTGFKTFERKGIRIATQTFLTLDVTLEVGTLEETITVTADAPLIASRFAAQAGGQPHHSIAVRRRRTMADERGRTRPDSDIATSLKSQGFTDIVFMGDSGGNMKPMQK